MTTMLGAVHGAPRLWLRAEGAAVVSLALFAYGRSGGSWPLFFALFLVPDVSLAAYLAGPRIGALGYNLVHNYTLPLSIAIVLLAVDRPFELSLIWLAHVGFDRALGYGLKYPTGFWDTHLGRKGRAQISPPAG